MLFDDAADAVHVLNGSAAFIWDCLKAPVSAVRIEELLREEYDLSDVPDVPGVIERALRDFIARKLVEIAPAEGEAAAGESSGGR